MSGESYVLTGQINKELGKVRRDLRDTLFAGFVAANSTNEQGESLNVADGLLEIAAAVRELAQAVRVAGGVMSDAD